MTVPQLAALLETEPDADSIQERQLFDYFDGICKAHDVKPADLVDLSDATLCEWFGEQLPERVRRHGVDAKRVRPFVGEYVKACRR